MSINATLLAQLVVFFILAWFTMTFVWPPIVKALDERAKKIADGLSAADKAKSELVNANKRVEEQLAAARPRWSAESTSPVPAVTTRASFSRKRS